MSIQVIVLFILLVVPLSLIIHEIGHIVGAKFKQANHIQLTIGSGKEVSQFTLIGVKITVRIIYIFGTYTATIREVPFNRMEKIIISAMGPLFNGLLATLLYIAYYNMYHHYVLFLAFLFNLWLLCVNLIPYKIGMKQSDGYIIYQMIRLRKKKES